MHVSIQVYLAEMALISPDPWRHQGVLRSDPIRTNSLFAEIESIQYHQRGL